jgi:hypothetical protein
MRKRILDRIPKRQQRHADTMQLPGKCDFVLESLDEDLVICELRHHYLERPQAIRVASVTVGAGLHVQSQTRGSRAGTLE